MKHMECSCGQLFDLKDLPYRPFVKCPNCGRRLPVHCEPADFMKRCAKCGRFMRKDIADIHCEACSGKHTILV